MAWLQGAVARQVSLWAQEVQIQNQIQIQARQFQVQAGQVKVQAALCTPKPLTQP